MVHILDAASSGHRRIRINDTDVVVVAISVASTVPTNELWIMIIMDLERMYRISLHIQ